MEPVESSPFEGGIPSIGRRTGRSAEPAAEGELVAGRYLLLERLGLGATADVYRARDEVTGQFVTVKRLSAAAMRSEQVRGRFALEAKAAMTIHHPCVVRVLDFAVLGAERPFIVMESLDGEPLGALLGRCECLPAEQVLQLGRHAAHGLHAAHCAGVLHRDVKPDNLFLLGPVGAPYGLKLIDFGFAKLLEGSISTDKVVLGTVQYMAPEQILCEAIDARVDVYALGVVLFRMLTGHLPFDAEDGVDLLSHHILSPVPPLRWLLPDVDPRLERVVTRATRKHPDNRYASMAELLGDLDLLVGMVDDDGRLDRPPVLAREPDVYRARSQESHHVVSMMARRHCTEPPPPSSSLSG